MTVRHRAARALAAVVFFASVAPLHGAGPPAADDLAAGFAAFRAPADVALSPDGRSVAFAVWRLVADETTSEERGTLYVAAADGSGERALTSADLSAFDPRWSPDGETIAFRSDASGHDELWWIPAAGGEPRRLTDSGAKVRAHRWLPDGSGLVYVAASGPSAARREAERTLADARVVDAEPDNARLWRIEVGAAGDAPRAGTPLTPADRHVAATVGLSFGSMLVGFDVSPDGRRVVYTHAPSSRVSAWKGADLAIVELASGAIRPLAATASSEGAPLFSPDGQSIVYAASDGPPDFSFAARLHVVAAEGGEPRPLALTPDERPTPVGWSADGREVLFTETRGTVTGLSALPVDGGAPRVLDGGDRVIWSPAVAPDRTAIGFVGERPDEAPQVFVTPIESWSPRQVSRLAPPLAPSALGRTEVIRWPGEGGFEIEGLLTYPPGHRAGERVPLLLVVHGGPTYYFLQDYLATPDVYPLAAFAARGFAILRPNPRGSSGRGRAFRFANRRDWGGADYRDLMAGVDHVVALGVADPERMGVMGWSYGGYMTAWIVGQTDRFRAASAGAGVINLTSFAGTSDILDFLPDYFGGPPWAEPALYVERSPLFGLGDATTPTLVQHGAEDRRVPLGQSEELYRALVRLGVEAELVVYPREEHGLEEPKHVLDAARRNLDWFTRRVRDAAPVLTSEP